VKDLRINVKQLRSSTLPTSITFYESEPGSERVWPAAERKHPILVFVPPQPQQRMTVAADFPPQQLRYESKITVECKPGV